MSLEVNGSTTTSARSKESAALLGQLADYARDLRRVLDEEVDGRGESKRLAAIRAALNVLLCVDNAEALDDDWVDVCAQLAVFGNFVLRCKRSRDAAGTGTLRGLLQTLAESPRMAAILARVAACFVQADIARVLDEIRDRRRAVAPLGHAYELFLARYNRNQRRGRGVFYTPAPIVAYLIHSVDHLLKTRFDFADGRIERGASRQPPLHVVDPACGSGVFLSGLIDQFDTREFGDVRMLGFDVLPAACAVGRMLLSLGPENENRPAVHWLDPLRADPRHMESLLGMDREVAAGNASGMTVRPPLVVIGNPPYANFGRGNRGPWIRGLLDDYKRGLGEKKLNLDDDFIKFMRWGQFWIDRNGCGILAFVTNRTYLDGLTHRRMRRSLTESFDEIFVLDLHGGQQFGAAHRNGSREENVFDIRQGVAIGIFVKTGDRVRPTTVHHAELRGDRNHKFDVLQSTDTSTTKWTRVESVGERCPFTPRRKSGDVQYESWPSLTDIFCEYVSGVQTKKDALFVGFTPNEVESRMRVFLDPRQRRADPTVGGLLGPRDDWIRRRAEGIQFSRECILPYLVSPFDRRWIYYDRRLLGRGRWPVMRHMLADNLALVFMRQSTNEGPYDHFLAARTLVSDRVFSSAHGAPFLAPLFRYDGQNESSPTANFSDSFIDEFARSIGMRWTSSAGIAPTTFGPRRLFDYLYAVVHAPSYRRRFRAQLRIGFPRVPFVTDASIFRRLCQLGSRLVDLHAFTTAPSFDFDARFPIRGDNRVERRFPDFVVRGVGRVFINPRQFIASISAADWQFSVGGYAPLRRWLSQRRGRCLTEEDIRHVLKIHDVVRQTSRLAAQLDEALLSFL